MQLYKHIKIELRDCQRFIQMRECNYTNYNYSLQILFLYLLNLKVTRNLLDNLKQG